jgi:solute carrier family 25 carnitine/acylcarnitine transporter 20/29
MYSKGGIRFCFKGLVPTALRELSFGPYFLTYEFICQNLSSSQESTYELSGSKVILAGGSAGIVAWCSTYFAGKNKKGYFFGTITNLVTDVVKTRIQSEPHRFKGIMDCMRSSYREEGWRIFFRGLTPTILRAFPSNAATFAAYTWTMKLFETNYLSQHAQEKALT